MNRSLWAGSSPLHHILSVPLARHVLVYHLARFRISTSGHVVADQGRVRLSTSGHVIANHQTRVCLSTSRQQLLSLAAANHTGFDPVFRNAECRNHRRALCRRRVGNTGHLSLAFSLLGRLTHIVAAGTCLFQEPVAHKSNYLIFCVTNTHYYYKSVLTAHFIHLRRYESWTNYSYSPTSPHRLFINSSSGYTGWRNRLLGIDSLGP